MDGEHWRQIANSQDRKKIQNRLAQRRRRMRLKLGDATMADVGKGTTDDIEMTTKRCVYRATTTSPPTLDTDTGFVTPDLGFDSQFDANDFILSPAVEIMGTGELGELSSSNTDSIDPFLAREGMHNSSRDTPSLTTDTVSKSPLLFGNEQFDSSVSDSCGTVQKFLNGMTKASMAHLGSSTLPEPLTKSQYHNMSRVCYHTDSHSARLTPILRAMKEAGFATFDEMAALYYTANFPTSSAAYEMQRESRNRHFRAFLSKVKADIASWSARERRGWAEETMSAAEGLYAEEIRTMLNKMKVGNLSGWDDDANCQKALLQEHLPELWSLLNQIVVQLGLEQPYSSKVILMVLQIMMGASLRQEKFELPGIPSHFSRP